MRRNFGDKDYSSANGTAAVGGGGGATTMGANDRLIHQTSNNNIPLVSVKQNHVSKYLIITGWRNQIISERACFFFFIFSI